jgi:hypothetical protein
MIAHDLHMGTGVRTAWWCKLAGVPDATGWPTPALTGVTAHCCRLTETDLRLLPTIARYDAVYATLFKCSSRRVSDYPHLHAWLRDIWQLQLPWSSMQVGGPDAAAGAVCASNMAGVVMHLVRAWRRA